MNQEEQKELIIEAVDLGDIDTLEESIAPGVACGCGCYVK